MLFFSILAGISPFMVAYLEERFKISFLTSNSLILWILSIFCSNGVTDSCYNSDHPTKNEGKHPIFLGPAVLHFDKEVFLFSRFTSEMPTHRPAISKLKTIRTDLQKTIFNCFLSEIKDLKLLLCVFHLQQNDKRRLPSRHTTSFQRL